MKLPRRSHQQRGVAAVEFALVSLFFFALLFGIIEMGWLLWTWNAAVEATRRVARLAVVCDISDAGNIKNQIEAGKTVPGLTAANIEINYLSPVPANNPCTTANCQSIEVKLTNFEYTPIVGIVPGIPLPAFTTTLRREWMSGDNPDCDPPPP